MMGLEVRNLLGLAAGLDKNGELVQSVEAPEPFIYQLRFFSLHRHVHLDCVMTAVTVQFERIYRI